LEDQEILQRDLGEHLSRNAKILGKHLWRRMGEPVRYQQRVELAGIAIVEADHKFATVGPEALQRMRLASRKIPEVTLVNVGNKRPADGIENRDATTAVGHDRPLRGLVPMQFSDPASRQAHVDAGDGV